MHTNFCQVVPGSSRPLESDVKLLAYLYWERSGKPVGKDLYLYYFAEDVLTDLANNDYTRYLNLIYMLRGEK